MTGRSLHDALLRVLTSAELRRGLGVPGDGALAVTLGSEEAAVLRAADPERLGRLARFMGRHFYRERIVRLFAAGRALARRRGEDPLGLLRTPAFDALRLPGRSKFIAQPLTGVIVPRRPVLQVACQPCPNTWAFAQSPRHRAAKRL